MLRRMLMGAFAAACVAGGAHAQPQAPAAPAQMRLMSPVFFVTDLERSTAFYVKGLGLTAVRRIEGSNNIEVPLAFPGGGPNLLLLQPKSADGLARAARGDGRVIVETPDIHAAEAQLKRAGYALRGPISSNPRHKVSVAFVADPDGNEVELVQRDR